MLPEQYKKISNDPVKWAETMLSVNLWSKQKEILRSVFENEITAVASCHAVGKTFIGAVAVLTFLLTKIPCKILTTAPTYYQVKDLLWSEINTLAYRLQRLGIPLKVLTTQIKVRSDWFAEGLSPKSPVNFHGFHQKHILCVFDESPGVRQEIVEGAMGLMASGDCHLLHLGNPIERQGHFWELFSQTSDVYKIKKIRICYKDTPNFTNENIPEHIKGLLISKKYVEFMREVYGEHSAIFASKCLGDFPISDTNQVISYETIQESLFRYENREFEDGEVVMGVDVARYGDDFTVFCVRNGNYVQKIEYTANSDTMDIVGRVINMVNEFNIKKVVVDSIGIGAGVCDRLKEVIGDKITIIDFNSAEKALETDKYYNRRAEIWFMLKKWLKEGGCIPENKFLIQDLMSVKYRFHSSGKLIIESKEDIKKTIGRSTDFGDALCLSLVSDVYSAGDFIFEIQRFV